MERAGYTPEDFDDGPFEVWPDNWPVALLFSCLSTQWAVGMSGPTGLRYEAAYPLVDRAASTADEWDALFADLRILERAALDTMNAT